MRISSIKVGSWYETRMGVGEAVRVGGTHPPSVEIRIVYPFPRGLVHVAPRDVWREAAAPRSGAEERTVSAMNEQLELEERLGVSFRRESKAEGSEP